MSGGIDPVPGARIQLRSDDGELCVIELITECDDGSFLAEIISTEVKAGPWSELGGIVNIEVEHK